MRTLTMTAIALVATTTMALAQEPGTYEEMLERQQYSAGTTGASERIEDEIARRWPMDQFLAAPLPGKLAMQQQVTLAIWAKYDEIEPRETFGKGTTAATFFPPTTIPAAIAGAANYLSMPSAIPLWRVWLAMDRAIKLEFYETLSRSVEMAQRQ